MSPTMTEFAELLITRGMATADTIVPATKAEVDEVRADQGVERLPAQYEDFLLVMGRKAGELLVGTDFFYPKILGLGTDGRELLEENDATGLLAPGSLIIGMHQGYELYWLEPGQPSGKLHWYKEGQQSIFQTWPTLWDFLVEELEEERKLLGK